MSTIVKIDTRSKEAKSLLTYLRSLSFVKVEEKDPYDPEFVKMVLKSAASKKRYKVDTDDIWGSLGLK
jgi:hypothetical protein